MAGTPRWYRPATAVLCLTLIGALLITPLRWPWTVAVLLGAGTVLWRAMLQEQGRARFPALRVYRDFSLALIERDGSEVPASSDGRCWLSSWLIVLPLDIPSGARIRVLIPRELNDPDAFRRFKVVCRFGFAMAHTDRHNGLQSNTTGA